LKLDGSFRQIIETSPGVRRYWKEGLHAFAEPFRSYVSGLVDAAEHASSSGEDAREWQRPSTGNAAAND